jgi:5-hydroxyisourate hydrolase
MSVLVRVINCTYGRPAVGVPVRLERDIDGAWVEQERDLTDDEGCISQLGNAGLARGIYRLEFDLDSYFFSLGIAPFYPAVSIRFRMTDPTRPCDISLLITPSAYFTFQLQ